MHSMHATAFLFSLLAASSLAADTVSQPGAARREFYVSPSAPRAGDGSAARPWPSVRHALEKVGGGNTIILEPGLYPGTLTIPARFAGTLRQPTEIRSEGKWKAAIVGHPTHGIMVQADHVIIDGLEVYGARFTGIKTDANDTTVRNCWIHNNYLQGVEAHGRTGVHLERNLIEYNGISPAWHHGVYASGKGHRYLCNVIRWNAGFGLHLYGDGGLSHSLIAGNLCHDNAAAQILVVLADEGPAGPVLIAHNTCFGGRCGIRLQNGAAPASHAVLNNICTGNSELPIAVFSGKPTVTIDYNLLGKPQLEGYSGYLPPEARGAHNVVTSAPIFVFPMQSIFWLRPDSPARGMGRHVDCAPPITDLFGNPWIDGAIDVGAFHFRDGWTLDHAKELWPSGYPYGSPRANLLAPPDLWKQP